MSEETVEYSITRSNEERHRLSPLKRVQAGAYRFATEFNQMDNPYEDAAAIKTGEALMVVAERTGKKIKEKYRKRMQKPPLRSTNA